MEDVREIRGNQTLTTALGLKPLPSSSAIGDWLNRATFYRRQKLKVEVARISRPVPRALPPDERTSVWCMLNDDRFADLAPAQVYATLLDEGTFVCSIPTMYRILRENRQIRERCNQLRHPQYQAPELLATGPN